MQQDTVQRAMAGDHQAFAQLAERVIGRLYATARLIVRNDAGAEDAVQEALVNAWRFLPSLRDPERFDAWLHRLVVNACRHELRRHRSAVVEVGILDLAGADPDVATSLANHDQLERGFRRLDVDQRAVIVLHFYGGHALTEVAEILDVPLGTVKSRLHRATQTLRAALEADARLGIATEGARV